MVLPNMLKANSKAVVRIQVSRYVTHGGVLCSVVAGADFTETSHMIRQAETDAF